LGSLGAKLIHGSELDFAGHELGILSESRLSGHQTNRNQDGASESLSHFLLLIADKLRETRIGNIHIL
jgi:hypothetical protein